MFASFFLLKSSELFVLANIQVVYIYSVELLLSVEIKLETRSPCKPLVRKGSKVHVRSVNRVFPLFVRKTVIFHVLLEGC